MKKLFIPALILLVVALVCAACTGDEAPADTTIASTTAAEEPSATPTEAVEGTTEAEAPTEEPTAATTEASTEAPTEEPTEAPTEKPIEKPTEAPTEPVTEPETEPLPMHYLATDKTVYTVGEPIMVTATGVDYDWVGLYAKDALVQDGGGASAAYWYYIANEGHVSGENMDIHYADHVNSVDCPDMIGIPAGEYKIVLCVNNGYEVVAEVYITVQ